MFYSGKRVFITGSFGFLGSWLTEALIEQGAKVTTLLYDRIPNSMLILNGSYKKTSVIRGDVTNFEQMKSIMKDQEFCFHLAAQPLVTVANRNPLSTFSSNIEGTWNVLEAARLSKSIQGVIVASSDKVYGDSEKLPYREDFPLNAAHPYDVSKACTDVLAQTYFNSYQLPVGIARSGNFYGGGDPNFDRLIPGTIRSLLRGNAPYVRSDGTFVRDYFYVKDAIKAFLALGENIDRVGGEAFNFGTEEHFTVLEIIDKLIAISGVKVRPEIGNTAKNEIKSQYLDCSKAKRLLGLGDTTPIGVGLRETFEWYKAHGVPQ